ncbi:MAG: hypothetical protein AB1453_12180 [Chloroflexota bacterium]
MGLFDFLFEKKPYPSDMRVEVERMIEDLARIGEKEGFLSERSGGAFNAQCRHIRVREIGARLNQIGGFALMEYVQKKVRKRLGANMAAHLAYAWTEIGKWVP